MNIKDAKEQIKNAMITYFSKDEFGEYSVPLEKQRPVFLMGPPGIGKTAIIGQIASEMGVGMLSYSMTHHTRQSALGLPYIEHKNYKGLECDITEYTMSEIIASVYEMMEETGVEEGILFLDEINCVSETLAPIMLQFLQYKVFGRHRVPNGWIVVTAGNPPEYNNSVREFDIVTWDRLKRIDVEPNYDVWKEYAYQSSVHPAIITYLEIRKDDFYRIESTVDGKTFVTARGWDDLSLMIKLYEKNGIKVDEKLVRQYIQNPKIAKNFAIYYDIFNKYKSDYQIEGILDGSVGEDIIERASNAKFDERLSLLGLLLDAAGNLINGIIQRDQVISELIDVLKEFKLKSIKQDNKPSEVLGAIRTKYADKLETEKKSGIISYESNIKMRRLVDTLSRQIELIENETTVQKAFCVLKDDFDNRVKQIKKDAEVVKSRLSNVFAFCEKAFNDGQELLILVTELTANTNTAQFISRYGCEEYFKYNKDLLFYERELEIDKALAELNLE